LITGYDQLNRQIEKLSVKIDNLKQHEHDRGVRGGDIRDLKIVELPLSQASGKKITEKDRLASECINKCQDFIK